MGHLRMVKQNCSDLIDNKVIIPPQGESPASPKSIVNNIEICDGSISIEMKL